MHIGFVGLGNMGRPMARRLLSAGHGLTVFDLDSTKAAEVAQAGANVADSVSDLGEPADIIFASLPSCEASRSVAREVLRGGRVKIYVETSTIGRETIRRIVEMAPLNVPIIDAPISGGARGAQDGTLAIMVAGSHPTVMALQPLFAALANRVFHVGEEPGLAQVCKLANNAISFTALIATCEAVVMAVKAGVNASTLIDVINASTGRNAATLDRFPNAILPRTFNGGAPLGGALKDLELYLNEAHHGAVVTDVVQRVFETWQSSLKKIGPDADFTNIVRYFEQRAGVEVKGGDLFKPKYNRYTENYRVDQSWWSESRGEAKVDRLGSFSKHLNRSPLCTETLWLKQRYWQATVLQTSGSTSSDNSPAVS